MGHKYLREIVKKKPFYREFPFHFKYWKQRAQYGFDERETYELKNTFYDWLYERLRMYLDLSREKINLNYHHFVWKGKEYTQYELMIELLNCLEFYLKTEADGSIRTKIEKSIVDEIGEIWAILLPAMWW